MLCQLGDFMFESGGVNLANIKRDMHYKYEKLQLINDFDHWQPVSQFSQTLTMNGTLIKQPNTALSELQQIAAKKQPVTLAFDDGQAVSVFIVEIATDESNFLSNGAFLKQDFTVSLEVAYGANSSH